MMQMAIKEQKIEWGAQVIREYYALVYLLGEHGAPRLASNVRRMVIGDREVMR